MSIEDNKSIVLSLYNARNQRNFAVLDQVISPDLMTYVPGNPQPLRGPEGVKQSFIEVHNAFPDLSIAINDQMLLLFLHRAVRMRLPLWGCLLVSI
jgi:SnoaL-like polyketide cyclase